MCANAVQLINLSAALFSLCALLHLLHPAHHHRVHPHQVHPGLAPLALHHLPAHLPAHHHQVLHQLHQGLQLVQLI